MSIVPASAFAEVTFRQSHVREEVAQSRAARRAKRVRRNRRSRHLSGVTYVPAPFTPDNSNFTVGPNHDDGAHERIAEPQPAGRS
jgi:hypothetical protein